MEGRTLEAAYSEALTAVATGATWDETRRSLMRFPHLSPPDLRTTMNEAYDDARSCGVEDEDIDPSWHTHERGTA